MGVPRFMKNIVSLVVIVGLIVAGWVNRDKLSGLWSKAVTSAAEKADATLNLPDASSSTTNPASRAAATPHPAAEARARAIALYPGI